MASITKQLVMKLMLERIFKPEIKRIFNSILQDFRVIVATTGFPPQSNLYKPVWEVVLKKHYRRVQKKFSGLIDLSKEEKQLEEEDKDELFLLSLLAWRDKQAPKQADIINNTTQFNMSDAITMAREQAAAEGKILSNRELAAAATALLKRKFRGRVSGIAMTETQSSAESTKFIEAEVLSDLTPRIVGGGLAVTLSTKSWTTVGDNKVRPIHKSVNGQMKKLNEPYIVNSQFLMHPGDSSLGASVDNVANCRCISTYSL